MERRSSARARKILARTRLTSSGVPSGLGEFGGEGGSDDGGVFGVREAVERTGGGRHAVAVSGGGQIGATRGTGLLS